MSKSLILLRHAKSSWVDATLDDFERPLNKRGERAAAVIGTFLRQEQCKPDLVLCSSARRTSETWQIIRGFLPRKTPVEFTEEIYEASPEQLLTVLKQVPGDVGTLLLIGHNPGMERLTSRLCGRRGGLELERLHAKFPTGATAFIELDIEAWEQIEPGKGTLTQFVTPKELV